MGKCVSRDCEREASPGGMYCYAHRVSGVGSRGRKDGPFRGGDDDDDDAPPKPAEDAGGVENKKGAGSSLPRRGSPGPLRGGD